MCGFVWSPWVWPVYINLVTCFSLCVWVSGDSHGLMRESLATVQSARARLQQRNASTVSHFLSLKPLIFDQEELERGLRMAQAEEQEEEQEELLRMTLSLRMAAWLNIGSVFLTGMTYYATIPTTQVRPASRLWTDGLRLGPTPSPLLCYKRSAAVLLLHPCRCPDRPACRLSGQAYADALGLDLSYSGIIIGMSPIAQVYPLPSSPSPVDAR